ncbi:MAG: hypothetical protein ABI806_04305 [Candidatus Solibacter sp.]
MPNSDVIRPMCFIAMPFGTRSAQRAVFKLALAIEMDPAASPARTPDRQLLPPRAEAVYL